MVYRHTMIFIDRRLRCCMVDESALPSDDRVECGGVNQENL